MNLKEKKELWLDMTRGLVQSLITKDEASTMLSDLTKAEFAFLANREIGCVDQALGKICLAAGETEVKGTFNSLPLDTQRALFARIQTAYSVWCEMAHKEYRRLWHPPRDRDLWRAIFLAMVVDQPAQTALQERIQVAELQSAPDSK